jgi:hypothetical protein
VIVERKSGLYRRILLCMVSGESRARRGNILRRVPVALWKVVRKCFVKSGLESYRRPRYFTVLDQGMVSCLALNWTVCLKNLLCCNGETSRGDFSYFVLLCCLLAF